VSKRTAILSAATRSFATKGFRETSTTDLAQMTGSAEGTVFYHFESKEKLFLAVLEHVRQEFERDFVEYLERGNVESGLMMVDEAARFYLKLAAEKEELFMLLHRSDAFELARVNGHCRNQLEAIFDCFVGVFERALIKGQQDGSIDAFPARNMALLIFTMVDGLVRLRDSSLYDPGVIYPDVLEACRKLVARRLPTE
jgi:AcrR family transcriptional regulator